MIYDFSKENNIFGEVTQPSFLVFHLSYLYVLLGGSLAWRAFPPIPYFSNTVYAPFRKPYKTGTAPSTTGIYP